jgi:hypothetical protein
MSLVNRVREKIAFALAGVAIILRAAINRAKLEDRQLFKTFGEMWKNYHDTTGFIFPFKR